MYLGFESLTLRQNEKQVARPAFCFGKKKEGFEQGWSRRSLRKQTCTTVPQIVKTHSLAAVILNKFRKLTCQIIGMRKCKRCGKYFIMKGNYDTNYCDRIAEGETRNSQELAAQENYKKKMADNAAIPLYQKYYKRYAARVRVRQIKEHNFKK